MQKLRVIRRPLFLAAIVLYAADFAAFLLFERPGLGIGHGFYVAIACTALATNAFGGAAGGLLATILYTAGVYLSPHIQTSEIPTTSTAIRLGAYVLVGVLIGHYAARSRMLLARADTLTAELQILARRDVLTGLPNQRAFEQAVNRRLAAGSAFALVLCELPLAGGRLASVDELLAYADRLRSAVDGDADVARVTDEQFAVLAAVGDARDSPLLTAQIARTLGAPGRPAVAGWATFPRDAGDALGLYTAASERLYARRVAQGELVSAAANE